MREQISNFFKKTDDLFFRKVPYQVYLFGCLLVLGIVGQLIYDYNHQDNSAAMLKDFKVELSGDDFVSAKDNEDNKDKNLPEGCNTLVKGTQTLNYEKCGGESWKIKEVEHNGIESI